MLFEDASFGRVFFLLSDPCLRARYTFSLQVCEQNARFLPRAFCSGSGFLQYWQVAVCLMMGACLVLISSVNQGLFAAHPPLFGVNGHVLPLFQ